MCSDILLRIGGDWDNRWSTMDAMSSANSARSIAGEPFCLWGG